MGCSSSSIDGFPSKSSRRKNDLLEIQSEKIKEDFSVPLHNYPRPRAPRDRKAHIYTPGGYSESEENAQKADLRICRSWHAFVRYLTQGMTTDIEKVRSLFIWMGYQNFKTGSIPKGDDESPLVYMKKVQTKSMSYAAFFVKICRECGLKAVVVRGIAKSVAYDVGDPIEQVEKLRNNWVAVHINGDWRLIFPLWAFTEVEGGKMKRRSSKVSPGPGSTPRKFNEFFFLTDPDVFIHFAFPDDDQWQLLNVPLTLERFIGEPFYRQPYFTNRLQLPTLFPGIHRARDGVKEINFKALTENWQGELTYQLFYNKKESKNSSLPGKVQLAKYVIMERNHSTWKFIVRFPVIGVYKLTIRGGVPPNNNEWICDFKLICENAIEDFEPLPCDPGAVGWGPTNILSNYGLLEPSQDRGTLLARLRQQIFIGFKLTKKLVIRSELVANKYKISDLSDNIQQRVAHNQLHILVTVPSDGEYALRMYARETKSKPEKNICNYLISTDDPTGPKTYRKENAFEKNLRKELVIKTKETKDPAEIDKIIAKFDKLALEDKGDLKKAKNRRDFLKLRKGLAEATERRHYGTLNEAIKRAEGSKFEPKLKETTKKAQSVKEYVYSEWIHEVLEMKQSTVAELKCYRNPTPAIFDTMRAVYILLGEDKECLTTWDDIHLLISRLGHESLLQRVKYFKLADVKEEALNEAHNLTTHHDLESIKMKSPAAGTFYVWVRDLVEMIKNEREINSRRGKKKKK